MKNILFHLIVLIQLLVTINSRSINITKKNNKNNNNIENQNKKSGSFLVNYYDIGEYHDKPYKITVLNEGLNNTVSDDDAIIINGKPPKNSLLTNRRSTPNEYHRNELNDFEKLIYDNLLDYLSPEESITGLLYKFINLYNYQVDYKELSDYIVRGVFNLKEDHPEIWFFNDYKITYLYVPENEAEDKYTVTDFYIDIVSDFSVSEINKKNVEIQEIANSIVESAQNLPTMYEKLLYVHDYLVKNIKYVETANSQTIYGGLVDKHCVCAGYARSFAYLSRLLDGVVIVVSANIHAWNYVKLDSKWYAVDVTWDDPGDNFVGDDSNIVHNYFLVGSDTVVSDKKYKEENIRDLTNKNTLYYSYVFPTLSTNAYEPPSLDPNDQMNYKSCINRLSSSEIKIDIKSDKYFNKKELFHHVCAPTMSNFCRYRFDHPGSGPNFEYYLKCSDAMFNRLTEWGLDQEVCFFNTFFSKEQYCKSNKLSYRDPEDQMDYQQCKQRIISEINIEDKRKIQTDINEIAHEVCSPTKGNRCRYRFDYPNRGPNYGYYLQCVEDINNVLKRWGHNKEICFTHKLFSSEKKCYNNGRDSNDQMNYEECKQRIKSEIEIHPKGNINYNIDEVAHKVCEPAEGNRCRYRFDFPNKGPNYDYYLRCTEDINNVLNSMGNDKEVCFFHKIFSNEQKCYNNIRDKNDQLDYEKCKVRVLKEIIIDPKGQIKFDINEIAHKVCLQQKGNHCRYRFGKPEEKQYYNNFIGCTEDINNILNDMGNNKEICYLHKDLSKKWKCFDNRRDSNDQMNYEQCKKRIKNEIVIDFKGNNSIDIDELAHKACTPTEGNRCRYRFDYPNKGPNYDYYLKCTLDMNYILRSWGYKDDVCFFHYFFSQENKCYSP